MYWCQQLLAESLGKDKKGFIPLVSEAPRDHHSLLQLYLDGPKNMSFYIFSSISKKNVRANTSSFENSLKYLNGITLDKIKTSQKNAFIKTLKENKILFKEFKISERSETVIGKLFFLFIFETIVLSKLLSVDPFGQPAVERVKLLTKKNLIS